MDDIHFSDGGRRKNDEATYASPCSGVNAVDMHPYQGPLENGLRPGMYWNEWIVYHIHHNWNDREKKDETG